MSSWWTSENNGTAVSTRIRLARNLSDMPFSARLSDTQRQELMQRVKTTIEESVTPFAKNLKFIDMADAPENEIGAMVERHIISPEFASSAKRRGIILSNDESISVMIGEEDHIRIQSIKAGLALDEAYKKALECDNILGEKLNIAFDKKYGYLTHCLTNLGLGMRVSVMMFLPALTMTRSIENLSLQLSKLGLVVRGMYGEGSSPDGCLYQISNRVTMGVTEQDTIEKLKNIALKVAEQERQARKVILSDNYSAVADRICRAYGVLKYARIMSSKEFLKLYSDVRLGIALGLVTDIEYETLGNVMIGVLPANLIMNNGGKNTSEIERDILRADYIRKTVG
jgi:protein arginine kinase